MDHFFQNIDGYASEQEHGLLLKNLLNEIDTSKKINIAEIGVYKGRCTAMWNVILMNSNISYNYFAIDHFMGSSEHEKDFDYYTATLENLQPIIDKINVKKNDSISESKNYPDEFFDIVYVDASHDYESVKNDLIHWLPKVKEGGIICGDDYIDGWNEVIKAVNDIFNNDVNLVGVQQWWKKKSSKVALVCIAKNEDNYIDEWIQYHTKLGFDDIFVYQNDWRWNGNYSNVHKYEIDGLDKQREAYNHFITNNIGKYRWAAFFDIDEFLVLKKHKNIREFIIDYKDFPAVGINWVFFGNNNHTEITNTFSLLKRFTKRQNGVDKHVKCIVKLDKGIIMDVHNPLSHWVAVDKTIHTGPFNHNGIDDIAQLNHYYSKTPEEFNLKCLRGRADTSDLNLRRNLSNYNDHNFNDIDDLTAYNFFYGKPNNNLCYPCININNSIFL